jgi:hypothetical protein
LVAPVVIDVIENKSAEEAQVAEPDAVPDPATLFVSRRLLGVRMSLRYRGRAGELIRTHFMVIQAIGLRLSAKTPLHCSILLSWKCSMRMTKLVVSFNRHYFAIALFACAVGITLVVFVSGSLVRAPLIVGVALALYFMLASVIASYIVYDASDLYKLKWWPARCLKHPPSDGIVVHAGFDPASVEIKAKYPRMRLRILDFFDASKTTEASIQRAHRLNPSSALEERVAADAWPVETASQDVVLALSAAHELRKIEERGAFFEEAKRVLKEGGKVIVIEQLRDLANFACFGVAAFHFLSRRTWLASFAAARLEVIDEFKLSAFMRAFVLQPSSRLDGRPSQKALQQTAEA